MSFNQQDVFFSISSMCVVAPVPSPKETFMRSIQLQHCSVHKETKERAFMSDHDYIADTLVSWLTTGLVCKMFVSVFVNSLN